ncbi:hypothetical protein KIN20_034122 [Parelaphostrongylus tenuis]|uniref:Uncharacterized protein n=1 Tax=Parelaphostrongylus tenuis TaxID=148309 RepID=A0AAD5R9N6_PARTN|nr:hypothetical protein KIN20_034122 [Parelaphostrongylus tenuis]
MDMFCMRTGSRWICIVSEAKMGCLYHRMNKEQMNGKNNEVHYKRKRASSWTYTQDVSYRPKTQSVVNQPPYSDWTQQGSRLLCECRKIPVEQTFFAIFRIATRVFSR